MTNNGELVTRYENRPGILALAVSVLLILSIASAKGQAPPPGDTLPLGLPNVTNNKGITMWSSENKVRVDFTNINEVQATISIYQITGQLVSEERFTASDIYAKEINNTASGYVVVYVRNAGDELSRKLFIVNNR